METEQKQNKLYEIAFLAAQDGGEEALNRIRDDIRDIIVKTDGTMEKEINAAPVRLAYEIDHKKQAFLNIFYFRTAPGNIKTIDDNLRHRKDIMRFFIDKPAAHPDQIMAATAARAAERVTRPEEKKKEVSVAELDRKLEKILEEEIKT